MEIYHQKVEEAKKSSLPSEDKELPSFSLGLTQLNKDYDDIDAQNADMPNFSLGISQVDTENNEDASHTHHHANVYATPSRMNHTVSNLQGNVCNLIFAERAEETTEMMNFENFPKRQLEKDPGILLSLFWRSNPNKMRRVSVRERLLSDYVFMPAVDNRDDSKIMVDIDDFVMCSREELKTMNVNTYVDCKIIDAWAAMLNALLDNDRHGFEKDKPLNDFIERLDDEFAIQSISISELKNTKLVRARDIPKWPVEVLSMPWQDSSNGYDCAIYCMRHMQTYYGDKGKWEVGLDLKRSKEQLQTYRIKYLAEILMSELKNCRDEVLKDANEMYKIARASSPNRKA
ncbi:OLC1v1013040C1 [Oldenlandia corymbosa var. corymbosa]|uniref:OLC1v1013040C1 n=1 Tax=Oldenlandia corymbosa var. corymbosa TaxID=529605 RepID=A0AAV1E0L6_OLDCO|nr:OLC1v1013040C1 [Oldenlandia corymbosa var. corymbosa]